MPTASRSSQNTVVKAFGDQYVKAETRFDFFNPKPTNSVDSDMEQSHSSDTTVGRGNSSAFSARPPLPAEEGLVSEQDIIRFGKRLQLLVDKHKKYTSTKLRAGSPDSLGTESTSQMTVSVDENDNEELKDDGLEMVVCLSLSHEDGTSATRDPPEDTPFDETSSIGVGDVDVEAVTRIFEVAQGKLNADSSSQRSSPDKRTALSKVAADVLQQVDGVDDIPSLNTSSGSSEMAERRETSLTIKDLTLAVTDAETQSIVALKVLMMFVYASVSLLSVVNDQMGAGLTRTKKQLHKSVFGKDLTASSDMKRSSKARRAALIAALKQGLFEETA